MKLFDYFDAYIPLSPKLKINISKLDYNGLYALYRSQGHKPSQAEEMAYKAVMSRGKEQYLEFSPNPF